MKTEVEKLDATRVKLTIDVTPEDLQPHMDAAYKEIAQQVQVPGFRKGKVPAAIIDQRFGREAVVSEAINAGLDDFYQRALEETDLRPIGRPSADIGQLPEAGQDLQVIVEVDVRPEFTMPTLKGRTITVDALSADEDAVERELEELRGRYGSLTTVDRAVQQGDFVQLDLEAKIDGQVVDTANGVSYEVGSGQLLDGIDEAIETLTADEETTFTSVLVGGDHAGQEAEVTVTVRAVQERELPEADDEFAQLASAVDTIDELREELREQVAQTNVMQQLAQARTVVQDDLVAEANIPTPTRMVEDEVHSHLEREGRLEDDEHRAEVTEETEKVVKAQILFDAIAEQEGLEVTQQELQAYVMQMASQFGMHPQELVDSLESSGRVPVMLAEILRGKTLGWVVANSTVVDSEGNEVKVPDAPGGAEDADAAAEPAEDDAE